MPSVAARSSAPPSPEALASPKLRTRPLLRAAPRAGEVSLEQAEAIVEVAVGDSEAEWVERANRMVLELEGEDREVVDRALDLAGKTLRANAPRWRRVEAIASRDLHHYATERLGLSGRAIEKRTWLERRLWDFPSLRKAMRDGRLGYEKARLAGVSECLILMCRHFVETYEVELRPRTKVQRVTERDRGLCTCPGCSKAADNVHHVDFRSHGGGDGEENLTSLCLAHHLHGVRQGYVRVWGSAPGGLKWELGERA